MDLIIPGPGLIIPSTIVIISALLSLVCLLVLHVVNPQLHPSWRMISEYALGKQKWLLTCFFLFWGISSILLAITLWSVVDGTWPKFGVILLFLSGIGEIMGGLFDVKHKLHGAAFGLGIPTLPAAALILSYSTSYSSTTLYLPGFHPGHSSTEIIFAHATWISVIIMTVSMIILFSGFKKAGIPMGPNVEPPKELPAGVIAFNGYANRLLVLCYVGWLIVVAYKLSNPVY